MSQSKPPLIRQTTDNEKEERRQKTASSLVQNRLIYVKLRVKNYDKDLEGNRLSQHVYEFPAIIDTGASMSTLSKDVVVGTGLQKYFESASVTVSGVSSTEQLENKLNAFPFDIHTSQNLWEAFETDFFIVKKSRVCLLGQNFLRKYNVTILEQGPNTSLVLNGEQMDIIENTDDLWASFYAECRQRTTRHQQRAIGLQRRKREVGGGFFDAFSKNLKKKARKKARKARKARERKAREAMSQDTSHKMTSKFKQFIVA